MRVDHALSLIMQQPFLAAPENECSAEWLMTFVGEVPPKAADKWLIPCVHEANPPATDVQLDELEQALSVTLPEDLRTFLQLADGARLYCTPGVPPRVRTKGAKSVGYRIFSTAGILETNQALLRQFRILLGDDVDFREIERLNYLAFCDARNDNYLAILLEGPGSGSVFFLHHDYQFRPYSALDADLYYTIAPSFGAWLELLATSGGWRGFGKSAFPL